MLFATAIEDVSMAKSKTLFFQQPPRVSVQALDGGPAKVSSTD
jgi:hypothetical protein